MKRESLIYLTLFFAAVLICCIFSAKAFGQQIQREGNTFVVKTVQQNDIQTEFSYSIKEGIYPIWITQNGRCYIIRISKKGN